NELRKRTDLREKMDAKRANVLFLELSADLSKKDYVAADTAVDEALRKYPGDTNILTAATQVFMSSGLMTNALHVLDQHLKVAPTDANALLTEGYLFIQVGQYDNAINAMTKVLKSEATPPDVALPARLNRAIASLQSSKLDEAKADYEEAGKIVT